MDEALAKVDYAFELFQKLGVEYFCFHDRDIAPEGDTLRETNANLDKVVDKIEENMKSTGVKLLWNTSSLFTNPRFVSGAATSPFADIYAYAGGQLKKQLPGDRPSAWAPRTTCSGVAVKATRTCGTPQMKRETGAHGQVLPHVRTITPRKSALEAQFLIEPKAEGADAAPVRLRCRHRHRVPAQPTT